MKLASFTLAFSVHEGEPPITIAQPSMELAAKGKQWKHYTISGKTGIKYDKILLQDMDNDGDMDIVITEEVANKTGLGVVWYENPLKKK